MFLIGVSYKPYCEYMDHFWLVPKGMDFHTIRFFGYEEWISDVWNDGNYEFAAVPVRMWIHMPIYLSDLGAAGTNQPLSERRGMAWGRRG